MGVTSRKHNSAGGHFLDVHLPAVAVATQRSLNWQESRSSAHLPGRRVPAVRSQFPCRADRHPSAVSRSVGTRTTAPSGNSISTQAVPVNDNSTNRGEPRRPRSTARARLPAPWPRRLARPRPASWGQPLPPDIEAGLRHLTVQFGLGHKHPSGENVHSHGTQGTTRAPRRAEPEGLLRSDCGSTPWTICRAWDTNARQPVGDRAGLGCLGTI